MSDPSSQNSLIQEWMDVSQGSEDQARFHLEANNWDLNAALSSFYQVPPLSEGLPPPHEGDFSLPPDPNVIATESIVHPPTAVPLASAAAAPANAATPATAVPYRRSGPSARIATLSSINSQSAFAGVDANSNDDDDNKWYAGGESSGMAVQPPSGDGSGSLVDRILHRATEGSAAFGSAPGDAPQVPPAASSAFVGHGRKLGSPAAATTEAAAQNPFGLTSAADAEPESSDSIAVRELTFWRNGFSIGDGPLYNLEDPVNRHNLDSILQGRAPLDILDVRPGQRVEMKIADRRGEDYVRSTPSPSAQPFVGQGRRLGGIGPTVDTPPSTSSAASRAPAPLTLDPSQPTVQVQIRMADGTRLIARANPSHTIGDLRSFVLSQNPDAAQRSFSFKSIRPPAVLSDDSLTIDAAGIANASIAQYFI
ncbi:protein phosphatase regulator [Coemansia sp. RSA 988]|nr:protein phosphatase regulator [Coemansia sp. RSA 988]